MIRYKRSACTWTDHINDYNHINIKHVAKKLFYKKNAEKLAINIIRTILITVTQLCLLTHDELYELNIENSNASKFITNLVYFLLNANILTNHNYYALTKREMPVGMSNLSPTTNNGDVSNTSANVGHSSPAATKTSFLFRPYKLSKSRLIIESIIKPTFEIILNLSDYYYDLMIKCSNYLKDFNYLLNKYKTTNSNFFSNLTYVLKITSLAYNRILDEEKVNACFERAKDIYYKSKIREINEDYRLKLDIARSNLERCKEDFDNAFTARRRSETAERKFLTTENTEYIANPSINMSNLFKYFNFRILQKC